MTLSNVVDYGSLAIYGIPCVVNAWHKLSMSLKWLETPVSHASIACMIASEAWMLKFIASGK